MSPDLKIGTTRTVLNSSGKTPWFKLRVNMWDKGVAISTITFLIRFILIPSRSGEDLFSKLLTRVIIWFGPHGKNSRFGTSGKLFKYDNGLIVEGGIEQIFACQCMRRNC